MSMMYKNHRKINGDYFMIQKLRLGKYRKEYYIENIDLDNYYIFKITNKQRQVSVEEFKDFKNAGYIFYSKELYDINHIQKWIDWKDDNNICINYLSKPLPPFSPEKIIIKNDVYN